MESGRPGLHLYRRQGAGPDELRLKIYQPGAPLPLSDALPMLENMGLRVIEEVPFQVTPKGVEPVWIHDFGLERRIRPSAGQRHDFTREKELFEEAFARVQAGQLEDDGYNQLVLAEDLGWRDVILVRAYSKYLRQARAPFSQEYMIETFVRNPGFARLLVEMFHARFDPAARKGAEGHVRKVKARYEKALDNVANLDEDRILRRFLNLVRASLRTNHYQTDRTARPSPTSRIKLASPDIDDLPMPRPWREIWVYSPRMEGIHLRGGPVARGGIRWSDRREDFRTEILGLMKAQMIKNPVIVPVGAKGGFVVKRPPAEGGREAFQAEGVACYRTLMCGLLDITDNRVGHRIVAPKDVVRHDGDDPYLVVAADKGTATFSDIANGIARDVRLLARRRLRLGRQRRLRPQEDGHHRARRLGIRQAAFPRNRQGHPEGGFHLRRRRRHGGRRVRQRHAAVAPYEAGRGVQPRPHLPRSRPRPGQGDQGAPPPVQQAALDLDGLRPQADLQGRRRLRAFGQVDPALGARSRRASASPPTRCRPTS